MSTEDFKQMVTPCDDPYPLDPTPAPATPEQRTQWLHDHAAPKDWLVFTESEVAELKTDLASAQAEIARLKAHYHFVQKQQLEPAIARAETAEQQAREAVAALAAAQEDKERLDWLEDSPYRHTEKIQTLYPITPKVPGPGTIRAAVDAARAQEGGAK